MRVFVDTNIFIDLLMKRQDFQSAAEVFSLGDKNGFSLHASVLTMANVAYIMRKAVGIKYLYQELSKFNPIVSVESISSDDYNRALSIKPGDFEDALQYFCAKSSKSDVIITRNEKDFNFGDIEILSPIDFLKKYS